MVEPAKAKYTLTYLDYLSIGYMYGHLTFGFHMEFVPICYITDIKALPNYTDVGRMKRVNRDIEHQQVTVKCVHQRRFITE